MRPSLDMSRGLPSCWTPNPPHAHRLDQPELTPKTANRQRANRPAA